MLNTLASYMSKNIFHMRDGVPQGAVLSCMLIIIMMNSLGKGLPPTISCSIYVLDVQMSFKSCDWSICKRQVQLGVNKLADWADRNAFKLNPERCTCFALSRRCRNHLDSDGKLTDHQFLKGTQISRRGT